MSLRAFLATGLMLSGAIFAEEATPAPKPQEGKAGEFTVEPGTKVPLSLLNSVSTKHSAEGEMPSSPIRN